MSVFSSISKTSLPFALALSTAVSAAQAESGAPNNAPAPDTAAYARCTSTQIDATVRQHIGQYITDLKTAVEADPYFKLQAEAAAQDQGLSAVGKVMVEEIVAFYHGDQHGITRVFTNCVKQQLGLAPDADLNPEDASSFVESLDKKAFNSAMEAYSAKVARDVLSGAGLDISEGPQAPQL